MTPKTRQPIYRWGRSLWAFSRPHTIIGTTLSTLSLGLLAVSLKSIEISLLTAIGLMLSALIPSLFANVYIVGLNQLTDINIDRINKPKLPLASGEFSIAEGRTIVAICGVLAIASSLIQGPYLFLTVVVSLLIGTVYSLPPLRLKRFPVLAAICILGVRGIVVNLGFFRHFCSLFKTDASVPLEIWSLTVFVILFAFAIAIFKDIPDVEGDRRFQIQTFSIVLGQRVVFRLALWVLTVCYGLMISLTIAGRLSVAPHFMVVTHAGLLLLLWILSFQINFTQTRSISQFYQFVWKLFFAEYLLFPLACFLR